jgi:uncharacterized protein (TIGR02266 family)
MAEGNRKDPRARVLNMTVRYKSATVDEFIENHSHDISRGGIFIKTRSPFPAGTLLKFEVRIAEDQKLMHGVGRVVWRREVDRAEESYPAGMGIKFIKTGEGAAELINQLIAAREGAESSFDAGVRESVSTPATGRPSALPPAPTPMPPKPITAPPTSSSSPALSVESGPRGLAAETETAVTSPAKKRQDQAPEKRKVVLQGPALESPPSKPRPSPRPVASADGEVSTRPDRGSIAEETTARRTRPSKVKAPSDTPRWTGLVVILGLVGLVVFVINRMSGPGAEEEPALAPTVAAEPAVSAEPERPAPPPAPVPPPVAEAPSGQATPPVMPEQAPVQPASATEPVNEGASTAPTPVPPSGVTPAAPAIAAPAPNAPAAQKPAAPTAPAPAVAPAANAPAAPPTAAAPQKAPAPAPAKPPPPPAPKPAPAPAKPAPKPSASAAPATPPASEPAPKPAEPAPAPPAAAAGSGGDTSNAPPAKKPPSAAAPTPPAAAPPAAAPPAAPAPTPPPATSDDNPY